MLSALEAERERGAYKEVLDQHRGCQGSPCGQVKALSLILQFALAGGGIQAHFPPTQVLTLAPRLHVLIIT